MKTIFKDTLIVGMSVALTVSTAHAMEPQAQAPEKSIVAVNLEAEKPAKPQSDPIPVSEPVVAPASVETVVATPAPVQAPAPVPVNDNETIIWNFLITQGFSRNQTAGIMGNLQQEHGFKTTDTPGGLGIAQWTGARREALINLNNSQDIAVQLRYLMIELNGKEGAANAAIRASTTVEGSTVAFQNLFERCGVCMEGQRIQYAYAILGRH